MNIDIGDLSIDRAEHGFVVYERSGHGANSRKWAFESADTLAEFIMKWGSMSEVGGENV